MFYVILLQTDLYYLVIITYFFNMNEERRFQNQKEKQQ